MMKLEFPSWCPPAVREHVQRMLGGEEGWIAALGRADDDIKAAESVAERHAAQQHRDGVKKNVDTLVLLATDVGMQPVYRALEKVGWRFDGDGEKWRAFIQSAWAAHTDVGVFRDKHRRARELSRDIATKADELSALLRAFANTGVQAPPAFFGVDDLLRGALSESIAANTVRTALLDGTPRQASEPAHVPMKISFSFLDDDDEPAVDPDEAARALLYEGWRHAPELPDILDVLSDSASSFRPEEVGMIESSLLSRKLNEGFEYLRAFARKLFVEYGVEKRRVFSAMAMTANVLGYQEVGEREARDAARDVLKMGASKRIRV